jgi:predicted permease
LPLDRNRSWGLFPVGHVYHKGEDLSIIVRIVTPDYLHAIGIHLIDGRDFSWEDTAKSDPVVIINSAAARQLWPGENPVGRLATVNEGKKFRVVGVVSNVLVSGLEGPSGKEMYLSMAQAEPEGAELVVRSKIPPEVLTPAVLSTLRKLNPAQPATVFEPIQTLVDHAVSPRRFFVWLVAIFAGLGLVLAALGIYGVISYSVTRQTHEIGIRMALGASRARIQNAVLTKTMRLALMGMTIGGIASFAASQMISSLLFKTEPTDPTTFLGVLVLLAAVAAIAGYLPARRATHVDPMIALRYE